MSLGYEPASEQLHKTFNPQTSKPGQAVREASPRLRQVAPQGAYFVNTARGLTL